MSSNPIIIPDDLDTIDSSKCRFPPEYTGHLKSLMIPRKDILNRVKELAKLIHDDYKGRRPVLICVLKGANQFFQHLSDALMELEQGFYLEFVRVSSYEGMSTTGEIQVGGELNYAALDQKDVILVEDIVDTGTTLYHFIPLLQKTAPTVKSVQVVTLLSKRLANNATPKYTAKYVGFSIPNHFIIGYGLDYNELYRDLMDIWVISQKGIEFDPKELVH